jgi:hypothetical protein
MESGRWLRLIAVLKLGKGVLLLAAASGAFGLVHRDLEDEAYELARRVTLTRVAVIVINVAVVWSLAWRLRHRRDADTTA